MPHPTHNRALHAERLGLVDYTATSSRMLDYTQRRVTDPQPDVILFCEHPPVYTQGIAGKEEHLLRTNGIPVVRSNRGGQITYHGPGQLVAYPLLNLKARGFFVKEFVARLESAALATLQHFGIAGTRVLGAPGVYVHTATAAITDTLGNLAIVKPHSTSTSVSKTNTPSATEPRHKSREPQHLGLAKIAALGIKVSRGCSYHGIALNVNMDTRPFRNINPCGYAGLETTDMHSLGLAVTIADVLPIFEQQLLHFLR